MILRFTVNIVCGDGLAFLSVGLDQLQVFDFYWNSGSLILCPSNTTRCFCRKMGGRQGSDGQGAGGQTKSEFWAGVPEKKKVGKKWGGGREEKKWAGVGRLNPRVWTPPPPYIKQCLEQIAMLWHSLNQCWLIISEVKWLLSVWSFIRMWWI